MSMLAAMSTVEAVNSVAIVGAGPAGFFAAEALLQQSEVYVDMFERLPAPYGLVRYGVAPDHQKIKRVEVGFAKTGQHPRMRYFGNVSVGHDVSVDELVRRYDQVVFAMGCERAKPLGIPGEELEGVHSALSFVSWYNGHPDYVRVRASLDTKDVVIVGGGDVAMDLCRLLSSTKQELRSTDMPDYALLEFERKLVENIHVLVRRGPQNANFALKELRDVLEREHVRVHCDSPLLQAALTDAELDREQRLKLELLLEANRRPAPPSAINLHFHFLVSPLEFLGDEHHLTRVRLVQNRLERDPSGVERAVSTAETSLLDAGLAILAVGYCGVPIPGLPIDESTGIVRNVGGRVSSGAPNEQRYVVGWLGRGPQGVIGTNKGDAKATVARMLEALPKPSNPRPDMPGFLRQLGVRYFTFDDWLKLDELERRRGQACGKPREKFIHRNDAIEALVHREVH